MWSIFALLIYVHFELNMYLFRVCKTIKFSFVEPECYYILHCFQLWSIFDVKVEEYVCCLCDIKGPKSTQEFWKFNKVCMCCECSNNRFDIFIKGRRHVFCIDITIYEGYIYKIKCSVIVNNTFWKKNVLQYYGGKKDK